MILTHDGLRYRIGDMVAEAATYRLYICTDESTGRELLLQISTEIRHNGALERAAFVLHELKQTSDLFEMEFARQKTGKLLDYDRLFPELVASFATAEHGKRRINILGVKEVDNVAAMVPLSNLTERDEVRVDLRSSAWIMGRLLKLLEFVHGEGIAVRTLTSNNVIIEPDRHFVVVVDWSSVHTYGSQVPLQARTDDIAQAAKSVFTAIGGDANTGTYPYETDTPGYVEFIRRLANGRESNAEKAHTRFYELVEELFGRKFSPFKTLPL